MSAKKKADDQDGSWVLVTTEHRGVFFGRLVGEPGPTVKLTQARNCLYWSADVKGFMGLAATGPSKSCRVGPAVPYIVLNKVTAVVEVSADAVAAWEASPWKA